MTEAEEQLVDATVGEGVLIVGVFYGGRDYEVVLAEQAEDS